MHGMLIALKIHVSCATKAHLDTFRTFELEERGEVEMKVCYTRSLWVPDLVIGQF